MRQVIIENPIINSPYAEPKRHFKFDETGITNVTVEQRRVSSYFVPVPQSRKKGKQQAFDSEWTSERIEENDEINQIRERVALWRGRGYPGITRVSARLLEYWQREDRERKLFFCQIEALETAIYIAESAQKQGDVWIANHLSEANNSANPGLDRRAFKMATGSGKTVVMAMIIVWHALNKLANKQDARFSDTFLIITPGITIRDRLRVLLPNDPDNYYDKMDLVPSDLRSELNKAKLIITNFHAFKCRETIKTSNIVKGILGRGKTDVFTETPDQMVRRVCREFGTKKNIVVLNDEAHHCYRRKPDGEDIKLKGDERKEAELRDEEARIWISGIEAAKEKIGVKVVYDLSATPFFLRGSGYSEGTLFPWVVSDFSLIDAIESGIVKVPRVPVADDTTIGDQPTYRDLWQNIRDQLPKKGRKTDAVEGEPKLPAALEGALQSLYNNYEKYYARWQENADSRENGHTPPVFIVVCNNTNVSKLIYDYIAGWEKPLPDGLSLVVPGKLPIFSNEERGAWLAKPNSILIDSRQLESGEAMSKDFKDVACLEIETFKEEYRMRFPGRDAEKISDEDLLREVMNTVGKPGRLGEHIKCVVSVSMLTEGWDANTVTHILGVRAFGTQLLCEQVVGRGLRRTCYTLNENEMFDPEYAEVYGVPFSFIPCSGSAADPKPAPPPTRVRALEERIDCEITFPRVLGYKYDLPTDKLTATFTEDSQFALTTQMVPSWTENAPIVGQSSIHTLEDLKAKRLQEVAFLLAKLVLEKYFRQDGGNQTEHSSEHRFDAEVQPWLFPQVLEITRSWLDQCLTCKDNTFPQMLLLMELAHDAADRIYQSIVIGSDGEKRLLPILQPYNTVGSTQYVSFETTRPVYVTDPDKCHISHVVADTESWEQKMASALEEMDEVVCYVKNHNLGFYMPYTINGEEKRYIPDFIARVNDGCEDLLNLVVEVSGEHRKDKVAKVAAARNLWVPAINNAAGFGRWAFLEVSDPWDAKNTIRRTLAKRKALND